MPWRPPLHTGSPNCSCHCHCQASIQVAIKGNRDRSAEVAGVRSLILSATLSLDVLPQSLVLDAWEEAVDPERRLLVEVPERQGRGAEWGGSASEESARRSLLQGGGSEMLGAEDGWRRVNVQFSIIPHEGEGAAVRCVPGPPSLRQVVTPFFLPHRHGHAGAGGGGDIGPPAGIRQAQRAP